MTQLSSDVIHASTISIGDRAVLLAGKSGAGKSDLALRLIDRGAILIADDYTEVRRHDGRLYAVAPTRLAGQIEVRGIGIVEMPYVGETEVGLIVDLDGAIERMPQPATRQLAGVEVPIASLAPFETSAAIKVELLLRQIDR
jgi:serine kinase of HPr protein (carbohydrate metabolism regulator)